MDNYNYYQQQAQNVSDDSNKGLNFVKSVFSGKTALTFLISSIVYVLVMTITLIVTFAITNKIFSFIMNIPNMTNNSSDIPPVITSGISMYNIVYGVMSVITVLISIFLTGVVLYIYKKCKSPNCNDTPVLGFKIFKVLSTIVVVFYAVICALIVGVTVIGCILMGDFKVYQGFGTTILVILAVIYLIVFAVIMIYFILMTKFFKSVIVTCETNVITNKGTMGTGVFTLLNGIFTGLYVLSAIPYVFMSMLGNMSNLFNDSSMPDNYNSFMNMYMKELSPIIMVAVVLAIALTIIYITGAMLCFKYNKEAKYLQMPAYVPNVNNNSYGYNNYQNSNNNYNDNANSNYYQNNNVENNDYVKSNVNTNNTFYGEDNQNNNNFYSSDDDNKNDNNNSFYS